jgi:hypothetical protein
MKRFICLTLFSLSLIHAPTLEAKTHRSYAVKAEFKRLHPCPANGKRLGYPGGIAKLLLLKPTLFSSEFQPFGESIHIYI